MLGILSSWANLLARVADILAISFHHAAADRSGAASMYMRPRLGRTKPAPAYQLVLLFLPGLLLTPARVSVAQTVTQDLAQVDYSPPLTSSQVNDPWANRATQVLTGQVIDFDAAFLTLRQADGQTKRLPSHSVERLRFEWATPEATQADELFHSRDYRGAIRAIAACYKSLPKWQQRILISRMVASFNGLGLHRQAGIFFLNLAAESPPPSLYATMPLSWTPVTPDGELAKAAKQWLESGEPHAKLLGASWLISGADRATAESALRELRGSSNQTLATLATFQTLRSLPPNRIQETFAQRLPRTDALLSSLQLGPLLTLADQMRRQGEIDVAVGLWSRIATQCNEHYYFGELALTEAARQLNQAGRPKQADKMTQWATQFQAAKIDQSDR